MKYFYENENGRIDLRKVKNIVTDNQRTGGRCPDYAVYLIFSTGSFEINFEEDKEKRDSFHKEITKRWKEVNKNGSAGIKEYSRKDGVKN